MHPPVDNEDSVAFVVEAGVLVAKLPSIIVRLINDQIPLWRSLMEDAAICFSHKAISKLLILLISELTDVGGLHLVHLHGALNSLHGSSILNEHPVKLGWHLVHLDVSGLVVVKYPLISEIL